VVDSTNGAPPRGLLLGIALVFAFLGLLLCAWGVWLNLLPYVDKPTEIPHSGLIVFGTISLILGLLALRFSFRLLRARRGA
jgi:hypothetical protein